MPNSYHNKLLPLLVLAGGLIATYLLQQAAFNAARHEQKNYFDYQSREAVLRIEQRLAAYKQVLLGARGLFVASKSVERDEFRDYVAALQMAKQYPGIQGVGFSLIIPPHEKKRHIESVRKEGFSNYTVRPEGERGLYTSIVFLEPFADRNLRAFGYDMYSETVRRAAMEEARDSDRPVMSGKVRLVQETERDVQAGFLMYVPVYRNGIPHETLAERRANILGWVYAPFRMNDLMGGILGDQINNIDMEIYDGKDVKPESMMYDSASAQRHTGTALYEFSQHLEIVGHNWHIRLHSLPGFEAKLDAGRAAVIWQAGIPMSLLLSLLVWQLASGRARALNLAEKMTSELRESEAVSRAIIEAVPVPLALNDERGNITYLNRAFAQTIGYTLDEIPTLNEWWPRAYPDAQYRQRVADNWQENMEKAKRGNEPFAPMELNIRCKDGAMRVFLVGATAVRGDIAGAHLVILYDITQRKQVEKTLAEKTRLLDSIIENIPNMIFLKRASDLRFELFNRAGEALLGRNRNELLGRNDYDFFPKEQADFFTAKDRATLEQDGTVDIAEEPIETPGGTRILHTKKMALRDEQGRPQYLLGISEDITERKRVEERLNTLYTAIEQSPMSVVITDLEATIQYVNPHFIKTTGYSREEAIGQNPRILQSGLTARKTYDELWETLTGGRIWRGELVNKRKNGEFYWEDVHIAPVKDAAGATVLYVAVKLEITQRRQAETALRESEGLFRAVFQNSADVILLHPLAGKKGGLGRFVEVNAAAIARYGYSKEELLAMTPIELDEIQTYPTPEDLKAFQDNARKAGHLMFERVHVAKDGRRIPVEVSSHVFELKGETMMLSLVRDVTERKKHEEELKRSNTELEQFGYAVSHDMRQPLRMIASYLQLIEMELGDRLDAEKRGYFDFAIDGAKRIDQMLVALLEYSRVGRVGAPPAWIDSRAIVDEALQYLQPAIAEAQAELTIAGEWPRIFVNRDEILRLVQNLVGNAVKFRVAGRTPEIAVTSEAVGAEWRFCVADNGVGLLPGQIRRLFQIFQRLQSREAYEGNGVGLALCRKIAEHHNGRIWAESAGEGQGSRFCVALPVLREGQHQQ